LNAYDTTRLVHRTVDEAYTRLGLVAERPKIFVHDDKELPACIYNDRTRMLMISMPVAQTRPPNHLVDLIRSSMAMWACHVQYRLDMAFWNWTQNKNRLPEPVRAMQGSPKWRKFLEKTYESQSQPQ
jgi:hypothetical protein